LQKNRKCRLKLFEDRRGVPGHLEESLKYKREKLDLYKQKLEVEKLKIETLKDLQKLLTE
jgi:hypothetical protein